jgi:alkylated DNA repair dioxygenase AlkB
MPEGLRYEPEFISREEEAALLAQIARLPLQEAKYKAYTARRRIAVFGSAYDFETYQLGPAPALPGFLEPLREKSAALLGVPPQAFPHALINEYRPGTQLGWHRDVPEFELVVGVSLAGRCRMRFRPYPPARGARVFVLDLEPRSVYVLRDEIRWRWQHSVAPTRELRYSVTFRTARQR